MHIPLDDGNVAIARTLIPEALHDRTWIAGSAACRWPEAWLAGGDLDLWITQVHTLEHHQMIAKAFPDVPETDEGYPDGSKLVYSANRIQILITNWTIQQTLAHFDLSCHQGAVKLDGTEVIPAMNPLVRFIQPSPRDVFKTFTRGCRMAVRYDETSFWNDDATLKMAQICMGLPMMSRQKLRALRNMDVPEGL